MGYRSKYNRRLRAAKRLQKRLAIAALLCVTVSAAAFMTLRETAPAPSAYAEADAAPARPVVQTVAAISALSAHTGARRVYPFSIVPGGVSGREEVVHVLQTDQVVAQHYAGLQVARLGTVTVSKPRAVYVSYRKGDKVYWTAQKVVLAQGETLLSDGSNEVRGRCGNRISDTPRLPVEANGPTMAMLDAAMDLDADEADDGERQAGVSSSGASADAGASSAAGAGQPRFLAGYAYGSGAAPSYARAPMLLAMSGMGGGASLSRPATLSATPTTLLSTQTGVAGDSSVSSGTPGATGTSGTTAGGTSGPGTGSGADTGTSGADPGATSGTPGAGGSGGGGGGTYDTPPKSTLLSAIGDPSDDTTPVDMPPLPQSLYEPDSLPVIVVKAPLKSSQVPEPDSLWLSGIALAAVLLARRKPRRAAQG
jgi:hypothetical protein